MALEEPLTDSVAFLLAKLGQLATLRFAEGLAPLGLRPRHCAVLGLLAAGPAMSQLELANRIGVTSSVVVEMLDELQVLGALRRIRDTTDRRRQLTELTPRGTTLLRRATRLTRKIDAELLAQLDPGRAAELSFTLGELAKAHELPGH
ncbi:MAG: MarR family transcriptional regulator [Pseudonocardiales bacterium]|nr:MAG: MarR family transcriptional regulator [Pseudonocardiales bacterium]